MDRLIEEKRDDLIRLCARYRVRRLELFGSALTHRLDSKTNDLDFLVEFIPLQPGELTELWQTHGNYRGARIALDDAIAVDQLLSGGNDLDGIQVMTAHKAKGKEFDAVVIFDDPNSCPLIYCKEPAPYRRSRKLARVAITRARHHVLILTDASHSSALLDGHRL